MKAPGARTADAAPWPGAAAWLLRFGLPFAVLNALLTLENVFPTLWAVPAPRLSFELCMAVLALAAWRALRGDAPRWLLRALAAATAGWIAMRYMEVTASAVFGRQIHFYWDGRHLVDVLRMGRFAAWQLGLGAGALAAIAAGVYLVAWRCWVAIARSLAWPAPRPAIALAGLLLAASFAAQGIGGRDTRWFFSMPVAPIVARQVGLLAALVIPQDAAAQLSPSPAFDGDLRGLGGADVLLLFAESYGACTLDDPRQAAALAPHRAALQSALQRGGREAVSMRVRSPTFGGASWLAHAALLAGVDTREPGDYELLLTTDRPTLASHFHRHGWRTVNWMPGLQRPWPEGRFYGFDRYVDGNNMGYAGPAFGHWRIPDQAAMALLHAQELGPARAGDAPRFAVFPTLASHAPFGPLAPFVRDWDRLLGSDAYSAEAAAVAGSAALPWRDPAGAYVESIAHTFEWLGDYLAAQAPPRLVTIVIGDHQPLASVSGREATWDVPVHVIAGDARLLQRLEAAGFEPGLVPSQPARLSMHELTPLLLRAFQGPPEGTDRAIDAPLPQQRRSIVH